MKFKVILISILALSFFSIQALAEVAVIVHPSNVNSIDADKIARIYLGKDKKFPDGSTAVPISLNKSTTTENFTSLVLNKSTSQLKAYWSKLVFTGRGTPPKSVDNDIEMIKLISANPNMIGFIDAKSINSSVKVISKF